MAIGNASLNENTTASNNTAVGYQSLYAQTGNAGPNDAFGKQSGYSTTQGYYNASFGNASLYSTTTGYQNTAIGQFALYSNTTASDNTAVGYQALYNNVTGTGLTAIGKGAALASTGNYNTIVGWRTGEAITSGAGNTIVGALAGSLSTGSKNTFIGGPVIGVSNGCASAMTTGSSNTIIGNFNGNQSSLDIRTASNNIVLSDGDGTPQMSYTNADGSWRAIQMYNNTSGSGANMVVLSSGTIARSTSSLKYKRDVQNATHGLTELLQLRPVTYKGKSEKDGETVFGGLIAEEVHATGLTEFVQYSDDGSPDALAYGNMVSLLVKSIQELKTIVDAQAAEITALKAKVGI